MSIFTRKSKLSFVILLGLLSFWTCGNKSTAPQTVSGLTSVTDIDGNVYPAETMGTQVCMINNLRTTRFNDGTAIPLIADSLAWSSLKTPGYCWWYDDSVTYVGKLYNWYTINTGKLAPAGWHIPSDSEWTVLTTYLDDHGQTGAPKNGAVPVYFPPLATVYRDNIGAFRFVGFGGYWWSSTAHDTAHSWSREMPSATAHLLRSYGSNSFGLGVLCVKDN